MNNLTKQNIEDVTNYLDVAETIIHLVGYVMDSDCIVEIAKMLQIERYKNNTTVESL